MSNLINFTFEQSPIRIIDQNGDFWFVANDVCEILEITNARDAISRLDDDEKADVALTDISSNGVEQSRKVNIINESGLYALILRSRKAMQKGTVQHKFRKWVTSEVLPSIRKTGQYRHTISEYQAHAISKAVKQKCQHNSTHYQTLYHALYDEFGITSYKELLASDFDNAMAFIVGYEFAPALNVAFIQNILADTAYNNKKAQHEIDGIAHVIKGLLHHIEDVQNRLNHSERCVLALQQRFIVS